RFSRDWSSDVCSSDLHPPSPTLPLTSDATAAPTQLLIAKQGVLTRDIAPVPELRVDISTAPPALHRTNRTRPHRSPSSRRSRLIQSIAASTRPSRLSALPMRICSSAQRSRRSSSSGLNLRGIKLLPSL